MTSFLLSAGLLTAAVLAILLLPLSGRRSRADVDRAAVNARLLREDLAALDLERASLGEARYAQAREELARRVLADAAPMPGTRAASSALPTVAALLLGLPICGGLLYVLMGTPAALPAHAAIVATAKQAAAPTAPTQVQKMVDSLAAKLNAQPDDPAGWAMLGRSYAVLGDFGKAAAAYARVGPQLQRHARWLAEYADALAMTANGSPLGRPERLAARALAINPDNLLALMLAGYAHALRGDNRGALPLLEHASREVVAGSEDAAFLDHVIAQVRRRMGLSAAEGATAGAAGAGVAPATPAAPTRQSLAVAAPKAAAQQTPRAAMQVQVSIAPSLRAQALGRTLFVIARVPGQRMPLAAVRRVGVTLPLSVALSDADSMSPAQPLSSASRVEIEARLSATGDAMPASGDLYGTASVARGGSVDVLIDHRRP
jgi:cytochrome c-type biogenesis protein CcmH